MRKKILLLFLTLVLLLCGCDKEETVPTVTQPTMPGPTQPAVEFSVVKEIFFVPSMVVNYAEREVYKADSSYGAMYVFSAFVDEAERFVSLQTVLLDYLHSFGIISSDKSYIATDYDGSFSIGSRKEVYISLNDMGTWRQVLSTLQGMWGDYTDYGYLYAVSNGICAELGWLTDDISPVSMETLDDFFQRNSYCLALLYPSFTERYASTETVACCKTLSNQLLVQADWHNLIAQDVDAQLLAFRDLIGEYALSLGVIHERQEQAYSFYAEQIPLRIKTDYAEMCVEEGYIEPYAYIFGNYFADDVAIYQTAAELTSEMADAVSYMELEGKVEPVTINWMSQKSGLEKYGGTYFRVKNHWTIKTVNVGTIYFVMHGYYRHLEHMITGTTSSKWQSLAFAEFGNFRHKYARMQYDYFGTKQAEYVQLFQQHMGRECIADSDDCLIMLDILAYINGSKVGDAASSVSCARYLMEQLGEKTVMELLLNPKQVEAVADRNWTSIEKEWKQHLEDFFASQTQ